MPHHVRHVALIVGSLRAESFNRKIADYVCQIAPQRWQISEIEIGDLPLYNQDRDDEPIEAYERVRGQLAAADVVLIVTPEHNRSVPAALKNVLDIASRPAGRGVWGGKKSSGYYGLTRQLWRVCLWFALAPNPAEFGRFGFGDS